MTIVVDSSIAASWGMPDERSPIADQALTSATEVGMTVPDLFWHELRNVFLVNERRGRLTSELTRDGLGLIESLEPTTDRSSYHSSILELARRHTLSAYDAAFLELAMRLKAPLATLDNKLAKAAMAERVKTISELG